MKQANILIDNAGTARVAGFGLMIMADLGTILLSETAVSSGGTFCWMSPELLDPECFGSSGRPTRESDCYALGMMIYEVSWIHSWRWSLIHPFQVLTGLQPFRRPHGYTPVPAVLRGERPEKPLDAGSLGFSHELWGLVQLCWSTSSSARPTARVLLDYLSSASLTWILALVYPGCGIISSGTTDSDSSGSLGASLQSWTGEL